MKKQLCIAIIIILCIIASVSSSFWYRANQVIKLKNQITELENLIEETENLLIEIPWNKQTKDYLKDLGYDIPEPEVQVLPEKSK